MSSLDPHELRKALTAFHALMQQVREQGDLDAQPPNPDLPVCWEVKNCQKEDCPCFHKPAMRCWQVVGTHCGGEVQGCFARKLSSCEQCEVYVAATATPTQQVIEAFGNMVRLVQTKQAALEKARFEQLEAERSERVMSTFLANMSHEIRTPLNGVLGTADLLARTELDADQQAFVRIIRQSGDGLLMLLNDVLDFSKMEVSALELSDAEFSVRTAAEQVLDMLAATAHDKRLELACRVRPDMPRWVRGDATRFRQILTNLVGNAIKFTESGEVVVDIAVASSDDALIELKATVRDTGIGMSQDQLERVFQPFTQADASTSRRFGGTGLGLTISRRLVELMGGRIEVESTPGVGTTFTFTIRTGRSHRLATAPADSQARLEGPAAEVSGRGTHGGRLLLAEDNVTNRLVATRMLEQAGYDVVVATNGYEVLALRDRGDTFDLVLMDVQMPGMDGLEATRQLRQDERWISTPIIALTAHALVGDRERCLQAGMDDYLTKPLRRHELMSTIARLLADGEPIPPRPAATPVVPGASPASFDDAVAAVGGDRELVVDLATTLLEDVPCRLADLARALAARDLQAVARHAHTLAGAVSNVAAAPMVRAARRLESDACAGTVDLDDQRREVEQRWEELAIELRNWQGRAFEVAS